MRVPRSPSPCNASCCCNSLSCMRVPCPGAAHTLQLCCAPLPASPTEARPQQARRFVIALAIRQPARKMPKTTFHSALRAFRRKAVFCRSASFYSAIRIPFNVAKGHGNASHNRQILWKHGQNQTDCRSLGAGRLGCGGYGKLEHRRALRGECRHRAIDAGVARQYARSDRRKQMYRQRILTVPDGRGIRALIG
jgi:hypothetical protein